MTMQPFHFTPGRGPVLVSMPHVGVDLPPEVAAGLTDAARKLPDTDWHVDRLYDFLGEFDCSLIRARHSRYLIDLNRGAAGKALYPGQSETELCPTTGFDSRPLYQPGQTPGPEEVQRRKQIYWRPYHDRIRTELTRIKHEYGYAILWDAHSIQSRVPRFFEGRLPDLNIGTADGASCAPALAEMLLETGAKSGFSTVLNGRFKGGYITRHYGDPQNNIHAVQLEIAQITYMDEAPTFQFREERAEMLRPLLREMMTRAAGFLDQHRPA